MQFSLRTLLFVTLLAGPLSALAWRTWTDYRARLAEIEAANASPSVQWQSALLISGQVTIESVAEREIWEEQRAKIHWESFPESQPSSR